MSIDQPVDIRTGEELNLDKLNKYLDQFAPAVGAVANQKQFPGGYSNLTYLLTTDRGEFILQEATVWGCDQISSRYGTRV